MGIVTIEDFEGSGELAFFGEEWGKVKGLFVIGTAVYATCGWRPRRFGDGVDFNVNDVQYLQTVKENNIKKFTITFAHNVLEETVAIRNSVSKSSILSMVPI